MKICNHCNKESHSITQWNRELELCEVCTQYYIEKSAKKHREMHGFNEKPMKPFPEWLKTYKKRLERWLDEERQRVRELKDKLQDLQETHEL